MTGPSEGKIKLDAQIYLNGELLEDAEVYIHVKGYSLARVTHLDVEHRRINEFLRPGSGSFLKVVGIKGGFTVIGGDWSLVVKSSMLSDLLPLGEETYAWVGGKLGGLYVGFKKVYVEKLEDKAIRIFNVAPKQSKWSR
ncbi:MAG: hypothetical protein N3F04_07260 [Candidatus Nezhaarchaeota archaeon]|nr:hypothetical protein [Candidatus Nezhaarchaeota archaeon]MCX8142542.1 hypothetical protein [Candidatus Nezhaarchaeota archaeon]